MYSSVNQLVSALDRFAQFFIAPLMKKNAMEREREAVDSEFEQALPSDYNRRQQIFGSLARPDHPMAKFMWGSAASLTADGKMPNREAHRRLVEFKGRHYSAPSMTLTVQSQEELDTLQGSVRQSRFPSFLCFSSRKCQISSQFAFKSSI